MTVKAEVEVSAGSSAKSLFTSRTSIADYLPAIGVLGILGLAAALFGADTPSASYLVSGLTLLSAAFYCWRNSEMRPGPLVLSMVIAWALIWAVHGINGLTIGRGDHYLMVLTAIIVFWMGQTVISGKSKPHRIWTLIMIFALIYSVYAFFQHIITPRHIFGMERPYHIGRLSGSFLSSNTAATYLGILAIISAAHCYRGWLITASKSRSHGPHPAVAFMQSSLLGILAFLFSFSALIMTASRAGITLTLCALLLFGLWIASRQLKARSGAGQPVASPGIMVIGAVIMVITLLWNLSGGEVTTRYETVFQDFEARRQIAKASWQAFQYNPVLGYGLGHFNDAKLLGVDPANNYTVIGQNAAHNFYLQTLVQSGVVGLFAVFLFYLTIISRIAAGIFHGQSYRTYLVGILMASFLVSAHGLFDYALEIPAVMLLHSWLLGLGYGLTFRSRR